MNTLCWRNHPYEQAWSHQKALLRVKSLHKPSGPSGWSLSRFLQHEATGVFLLPPGWNASPLRGYPQQQICQYPFIQLGEERHYESQVSCPGTQCSAPARARTGTARSRVQHTNHQAPMPPTVHTQLLYNYAKRRTKPTHTDVSNNWLSVNLTGQKRAYTSFI